MVCILGNAPDTAAALKAHAQWHDRLPSFWYLWKETQEPSKHPPNYANFHVAGRRAVGAAAGLSFADGIELALQVARQHSLAKNQPCEYFFTHDDDLAFGLNASSSQGLPQQGQACAAAHSHTTAAIENVLLCLLSYYRPAVASFPWQVGRQRYANVAALAAQFQQQAVAPLTVFDNGMVIYHQDVVDFFIPFPPRGTEGVTGHWTLGAHFLHLMVPLLFRSQALLIQALTYNNTINLDNLSEQQKSAGYSARGNLVSYKGVRHPYEYKLNDQYLNLLKSGLKCKHCRTGRDLQPYDVLWRPEPRRHHLNATTILQSLASFYDPRHIAVHDSLHRLFGSDTEATVTSFVQQSTRLRFAIHMFAYNRLTAFQRLWQQFEQLLPPSDAVDIDITIHLDRDANQPQAHAEHRDFVSSLSSRLGPVRWIVASHYHGLRNSILQAALPRHADEFVFLLEDDIALSPLSLRFAEANIRHWFYSRQPPHGLMGLSLYAQLYNEASEKYLPGVVGAPQGHTARPYWPGSAEGGEGVNYYAWMMPQSWGAVYHGPLWSEYVRWCLQQTPQQERFLVPDSYTNRWPEERSWKKALLRFMVERQLYLIYPHLPNRLSLTSNTLEVGDNDRVQNRDPRRQAMENKFYLDVVPAVGQDRAAGLAEKLGWAPQVWEAAWQPSPASLLEGFFGRSQRSITEASYTKLPQLDYLGRALPLTGSAVSEATGEMKPPSQAWLTQLDTLTLILVLRRAQSESHARPALERACGFSRLGRVILVLLDMGQPAWLPATTTECQQQKKPVQVLVLQNQESTDQTGPWYFAEQLHRSIDESTTINQQPLLLAEVDWLPSAEDLRFMLTTWQGHFFRHVLSLAALGRRHRSQQGSSLVLPYLVLMSKHILQQARELWLKAVRSSSSAPAAHCASGAITVAMQRHLKTAGEENSACPVFFEPTNPSVPGSDALDLLHRTAADWQSCLELFGSAAADVRVALNLPASPRKKYGSTVAVPGLSWLKCELPK